MIEKSEGVDQEGSTARTEATASDPLYAPLAPNVESCIMVLKVFARDKWPEHSQQGVLRSLRAAIREAYVK